MEGYYKQGFAPAQYNLGVMYDKGQGVRQNFKKAVNWYQKAAEQGHPEALYELGVMYAEGQGIEQDFIEAYKLLSIAAKAGRSGSKNQLDKLNWLSPICFPTKGRL